MSQSQLLPISCVVNGQAVELQVEPGETLLAMLRERLRLTGAKQGCEVGECGACTVLVDGVPTCSCLTLAALAQDKQILTIEGLSHGFELHPIQQAFIDTGAIQCGFCTPGMVLSCYALLQEDPDPTDEEIKRALSNHLCRCGAHQQIIEAVHLAAARMGGRAED